ncbi:hydrogenase maturation protease [Anaerotignum sp.]|uniref:hydrogenase maturation protease n=1 Tax=Anaerotignum sp. TaxID=2039241 RepID=UPI0027148BAB|nr:hydrogenase maturation protease [Anaerotignum sp.]
MIKLIAIGNRFMKDDGIAIKVAENLVDKLKGLNIEVIIGETDCQNCFYLLKQDDYVLIIDAIYTGSEPGSIHPLKLEEAVAQSSGASMQHDMSIIELMKLYKSKFKGYLIGVEIAELGFGDKLSPVLNEKYQQICLDVERTINKIILEETNYA